MKKTRVAPVIDNDDDDSLLAPHRSRTASAQNISVLTRALNDFGLTPAGRAIKHDHSYISRWRSGEQNMSLEDLLILMDALGLKFISAGSDMKVIDAEDHKTLLNLANKGLRAMNNEARGE